MFKEAVLICRNGSFFYEKVPCFSQFPLRDGSFLVRGLVPGIKNSAINKCNSVGLVDWQNNLHQYLKHFISTKQAN